MFLSAHQIWLLIQSQSLKIQEWKMLRVFVALCKMFCLFLFFLICFCFFLPIPIPFYFFCHECCTSDVQPYINISHTQLHRSVPALISHPHHPHLSVTCKQYSCYVFCGCKLMLCSFSFFFNSNTFHNDC